MLNGCQQCIIGLAGVILTILGTCSFWNTCLWLCFLDRMPLVSMPTRQTLPFRARPIWRVQYHLEYWVLTSFGGSQKAGAHSFGALEASGLNLFLSPVLVTSLILTTKYLVQ